MRLILAWVDAMLNLSTTCLQLRRNQFARGWALELKETVILTSDNHCVSARTAAWAHHAEQVAKCLLMLGQACVGRAGGRQQRYRQLPWEGSCAEEGAGNH